MFRQVFITHLKRTRDSLRYYYSKQGYHFYLKFPTDTENNEQIKKYMVDLESSLLNILNIVIFKKKKKK